MEAARKLIQIVRFAVAGAIVLYLVVILQIPSSARPNLMIFRALGSLAVIDTILVFVLRRVLVFPAEVVLENQARDPKALARWKMGHIITNALSLSIALYGLVLHFLGFRLAQVAPFLVAGLLLIVLLGPKGIAADVSPSAPIVPR